MKFYILQNAKVNQHCEADASLSYKKHCWESQKDVTNFKILTSLCQGEIDF